MAHSERTLAKLVSKTEENQSNAGEKEAEFQRRLDEILKNHGVANEAFAAEVNNLHRNL